MKELTIASNMIALARNRKGDNKRSAMLRMIMPMLSKETGDKLAIAIDKRNSALFARIWDKIKGEISQKLEHHEHHGEHHKPAPKHHSPKPAKIHKQHIPKHGHPSKKRHKAHAASVNVDQGLLNPDGTPCETNVNIMAYGDERLRLCINGVQFLNMTVPQLNALGALIPQPTPEIHEVVCEEPLKEACKNPEENSKSANPVPDYCMAEQGTKAHVCITTGQTGQTFEITSEKVIALVKLICERMLLDVDPCPLPPTSTCDPSFGVPVPDCGDTGFAVPTPQCNDPGFAVPVNAGLPQPIETGEMPSVIGAQDGPLCAQHQWPDCKVCSGNSGAIADFNANILELYDRLLALSKQF